MFLSWQGTVTAHTLLDQLETTAKGLQSYIFIAAIIILSTVSRAEKQQGVDQDFLSRAPFPIPLKMCNHITILMQDGFLNSVYVSECVQ